MRNYQCDNQTGAALPAAIFTVLILTMLSGIMMASLNNEIKVRTAVEERIIVRHLAEAGIEHALYLVAIAGIPVDFPVSSGIGGIGEYHVENIETNGITRITTITANGTTDKGRTMKITVSIDKDGEIISWQEDYNP
jgi:hypothetical protein